MGISEFDEYWFELPKSILYRRKTLGKIYFFGKFFEKIDWNYYRQKPESNFKLGLSMESYDFYFSTTKFYKQNIWTSLLVLHFVLLLISVTW